MPGDEAAATASLLGFVGALDEQSQEPERLWNDPLGCNTEMAVEMDGVINEWREYIRARTQG